MHAPWTACRPCVQRANRPRGLAISILELNQAVLPGPRARHDRGVGAHQSSPLQTAMHGGLHMADLNVNGKTHQVDVDPNTPLLWVLLDTIVLTGTNYGCGITERCRRRRNQHQHLPLRHLPAGARGDPRRCGERVRREAAMNYVPKIDRRSFVVSAAAVGGGLALGLDLPFGGPQVIRAQDGSPEVNAWVVIPPDDTAVLRVA